MGVHSFCCLTNSSVVLSHLPADSHVSSFSQRKCYSEQEAGVEDPRILILAFPFACSLLLCVPQFTHPGIIISTSQGCCEALFLRSLSGRWRRNYPIHSVSHWHSMIKYFPKPSVLAEVNHDTSFIPCFYLLSRFGPFAKVPQRQSWTWHMEEISMIEVLLLFFLFLHCLKVTHLEGLLPITSVKEFRF